jgi:hypothetical protein
MGFAPLDHPTRPTYTFAMAADSDFSRKFSVLKMAAERQRGLTFSEGLKRALNDIAHLPDVDDVAIADWIVEAGSATGAGFLAVWLGAGVERGRDPERTGRPIADAFVKWSRTIDRGPEADAAHGDLQEPDEETIAGLQLLGQALVAHLARSPQLRRWVVETDAIYSELRRVESLSIGAVWVLELLRKRSGKLVVLNVRHRIGVVVRYNNIATCFHLFTLLQGALAGVMPDAQKVSPQLLDIARGKSQGEGHDMAWWHYGLAGAASPSLAASVWGEAGPDSISSINGQQVMLLWPPILQSRSWDTGFFSPILEASLPSVEVLEVLSSADTDAWWLRLGLGPTSGC